MAAVKSETKVVQGGGIGLLGWLFLIFVTLKLTGVIVWSWWLVFAPLWVPLAAYGAILAVLALIAGSVALLDSREGKK